MLRHKQYSYKNNNNNNTNNSSNTTTNTTNENKKNKNNNNNDDCVLILDISIFDDTFKFYKMWSMLVINRRN